MTSRGLWVCVACLIAVGATGCGGDSSAAKSSTSQMTSTRSTDKQDAYLKVVSALMPDLDREAALTAGRAACDALNGSATVGVYAQVVQAAQGNGRYDVLKAKVLVDGAISAFCPEHRNLTEEFDRK